MLVERTWIALGGPACVASDADIEDAAAFFDLLDSLARGGDLVDFDSLAQRAADLFAAPDPEAHGAIELMTMHKAKGLEFDTVILPGLGRSPRSEESKLLLWTERPSDDGEKLLLAPISAKREDTDALCRYIGAQEKIKAANESVRLLYVAATRARRTLHLIGHAEIEEDETGRRLRNPSPDSLLARIWPAVKPAFESALAGYSPAQGAPAPVKTYPRLRRVPQGWRPASLPEPVPIRLPVVNLDGSAEIESAGDETARIIGTLVHSMLEKIAREGVENWPLSKIASLRPSVGAALANMGAPQHELESAAQRVEEALANTIGDLRGRWILADHESAQSELKLAAAANGAVAHFAVDRTFVEDGVRWVIDFKTAAYEGPDADVFIESERRAYQQQLDQYADLLAALDSRPIRAGLYFPPLRRWVEWTPRPPV
jgi:ATP-dependent exoDNAse (exonuclease V) beta subunit